MPSKSKQVREAQMSSCETAIRRRREHLQQKGLEESVIQKDPHLEHLKAKLRKTQRRLGAIQKVAAKNEELALRKKEKAAKKLREQTAGEPPPPSDPSSKKKKTKKKKET
jgi:hypothetical protein